MTPTTDPQAVTPEQVGRMARRDDALDDFDDHEIGCILEEYRPRTYEAYVEILARDRTFDR